MGENPAGVWQFIRAFWPRWFSLMSGGLSVPLAIASAVVANPYAQSTLAVMAVIAFVSGAFAVWRAERLKVLKLQEAMKPNLRCVFGEDIPGCIVAAGISVRGPRGPQRLAAKYFRVRVESINTTAPACIGHLLSTTGPTSYPATEAVVLPFAPSHEADSTRKEIRNGVMMFLDVIAITENNQIIIATKDLSTPFSLENDPNNATVKGTYTFDILVSSLGSPSVPVRLILDWTGDWQTATMSSS